MSEYNWAAGWNLSGYLPETDPVIVADREDAVDYLIGALERVADDPDEYSAVANRANDAITELRGAALEDEFSVRVGDCVYWIVTTDEPVTDDES